jgi:putative ABC transport system substrate-binding protein
VKRNITLIMTMLLTLGAAPVGAKTLVIKWKDTGIYNEAIRGFQEVYGNDIEVVNCDGSKDRMKEFVVQGKNFDQYLLVGETPLKEAVKIGLSKPAVYAMVYNPGQIIGNAKNITGASLNIPYSVHFSTIRRILPQVRKIGVLYANRELIEGLSQSARDNGINTTESQVTGKQIKGNLNSLRNVDLIMITLDPLLATKEAMSSILLFSIENKIPVYAPSDKIVKSGAVLGLVADYVENGRTAGRIASQIKGGGNLPESKEMSKGNLYINLKTAQNLGLKFPLNIVKEASEVFE